MDFATTGEMLTGGKQIVKACGVVGLHFGKRHHNRAEKSCVPGRRLRVLCFATAGQNKNKLLTAELILSAAKEMFEIVAKFRGFVTIPTQPLVRPGEFGQRFDSVVFVPVLPAGSTVRINHAVQETQGRGDACKIFIRRGRKSAPQLNAGMK